MPGGPNTDTIGVPTRPKPSDRSLVPSFCPRRDSTLRAAQRSRARRPLSDRRCWLAGEARYLALSNSYQIARGVMVMSRSG